MPAATRPRDDAGTDSDTVELASSLRQATLRLTRRLRAQRADMSVTVTQLMALGTREVPSATIGELALRGLKDVDGVAYIRFASVYREFADLEDLRRELEGLAPPEVLDSAARGSGQS